MPLIFRENIGGAVLLAWRITEGEEELCRLVTPHDRESARRFTSQARRIERLAWRAALRRVIPDAEVHYNAAGAPYIHRPALRTAIPDRAGTHVLYDPIQSCAAGTGQIDDCDRHISVAHTRGLAVVLISPALCAVDAEDAARDLSKVAGRFISPQEAALADARRDDFAVSVWCAKEVLYKLSGKPGLDFLRDLQITSSNLSRGTITGTVCGGSPVRMEVLRVEGYIIVCRV